MSIAAGVGAFLVGWAMFSSTDVPFIAAAVAGIAVGVTVLVLLRRKARELCSSRCVTPSAAVVYTDWYGTVHTFDVRSREYAALFMLANTKKLLNLTEDARQLMQWGLSQTLSVKVEIDIDDDDDAPMVVAARPRSTAVGTSDDDQLVRALSKLESLKGAASRRAALEAALKTVRSPEAKERLLVEASKIEVHAVLQKVDSLKTKSAKKRTVMNALDEIRNDRVSDELQAKQTEMLETLLSDIESE
jgi:hypothetical protein